MKFSNNIELNILCFSFLLNFVWEIQQMPMFELPTVQSHSQIIWGCTQAALGDAIIVLTAYWCVSMLAKTRLWIFSPNRYMVLGFVLFGLLVTVGIEYFSTEVFDRWQYREMMPTLPLLGTGLLPVLQWLLLPPITLWIVRRQVR